MDGSGFWVSLGARALSTGNLHVRISTIELVLGKGCVPAVGGQRLEVTLTDSDDATSWPVLLSAHGDGCCNIAGIKSWLQHRNAAERDKVVVSRQADGSSPKNVFRLVRAGAAETLGAAPGFDPDQQQQQQQQVQQVTESAMGSVSTICAAPEPRGAAPASDMAAATAAAAATAPQTRPEDDSAAASRSSHNCGQPCAQPDAFPPRIGRGDGRPGEPPSQLPGAMGPGGGVQHRSCTSTVPRSDSSSGQGVVQPKLEPGWEGAEQQQLHGELRLQRKVHGPTPAPADEGQLVPQPHPMHAESPRRHEAAPDHHQLLIAPHSAAHLGPPVVHVKIEPEVGYGSSNGHAAERQEDVQRWDQDRSQARGPAWQQWMREPAATSGDRAPKGCVLEADAARGAAFSANPHDQHQQHQQHDSGQLTGALGPTPPGDCWQAGSPFTAARGMSLTAGGQLGVGGPGPAVEVQQQCSGRVSGEARAGVGATAAGAADTRAGGGSTAGEPWRALYLKGALRMGLASASALWPGLAEGLPFKEHHTVTLYTRGGQELRAHPVKLVRYRPSDFRLFGAWLAARDVGVREREPVGMRRLPCGRLLVEAWQGQGQQQGTQGRDGQVQGVQAARGQGHGEARQASEDEAQRAGGRQRCGASLRRSGPCDPAAAAPGVLKGHVTQGGPGGREGHSAPAEAAGRIALPGSCAGGAAWRATYRKGYLRLSVPCVRALWPGVAEALPLKQHHPDMVHTRAGGGPGMQPVQEGGAGGQGEGGGQGQAQELRAYGVNLVRYQQSIFFLLAMRQPTRDVGVGEGGYVGLRRLPCGRLLVEAWQGQGQEGQHVVKRLTAAGVAEGGDGAGVGGGRSDTELPALAAAKVCARLAGGKSGAGQKRSATEGAAGPGGQRGSCAGGAAWRAVYFNSYLSLRMPCVTALWPGVAEVLPTKQHHPVTVYTRAGAGPEQLLPLHPVIDAGQVQEQEQGLRAHPAKLVRYDIGGFRLLGMTAAAREAGVGDKDAVGLRRLPCGRLLVEAWQGQEGQGQQQGHAQRPQLHWRCAQREGGVAKCDPREAGTERDTEVRAARKSEEDSVPESEWGSESEGDGDPASGSSEAPSYLRKRSKGDAGGHHGEAGRALGREPLRKRRRLQAPSGGGPGTAAGQSSQVHMKQGEAGAAHAPGSEAGGQAWHKVLMGTGGVLRPRVHVVQELWPELAPQLRATEGSAEVALHTAPDQRAGEAQLVRHTVRLSYSTGRYIISDLKGVQRALGLSGSTREVHLRRAPDGRILAALTAATHAADPQSALAEQQQAVQQQQPRQDIAQCNVARADWQFLPSAAPLTALPPSRPLSAASPTTGGDGTVQLCVNGGHLFPDTPSVSLLWPHLAVMAVRSQQPVRLRAARPRAGPVDYTVRLVRFGEAVWRLERTQALVRQLRLGEGDEVELAAQGGGVVGVRRAGEAKPVHQRRAHTAEAPPGQRGTSGDGPGAGTSGGGQGHGNDCSQEQGHRGEEGEKAGMGMPNEPQLPPPQRQLNQIPAPPHLPSTSLTPAHLMPCVPASVGPPPPRPDELRLCGLTFHPDLAPWVRRAMADWEAGLGGTPLHEAEPQTVQVRVLGAAQGSGADGGGALVRAQRLSGTVLALRVCELLGLGEVEAWGRELPLHAPVQEGRVERRRDEQRGGSGLWATAAVKKSHPLCVEGGYVMPATAAERFVSLGWRDCGEGVREELRRRVGGGGSTTRVSYGWKMLAASYCMPYHVEEGRAGEGEAAPTGDGGGPAPPVLCMLGYGNLGALANDPRVNPRAWQDDNDVGATHQRLQPNCGIVPVSVRGLVLPVLVALRDIAPGEQLLRDYGADWWRGIAEVWEVAEDEGLVGEELFWGRGDSSGGPDYSLAQPHPQPPADVHVGQSQPPLRPETSKPPPPLPELQLQATTPAGGLTQAPAHAAEVHAATGAGRSSAVAPAGAGAFLPPAGGSSASAPQPRQERAGLRQQGQRTGTSRGGRSSSPRGRGRSPGGGHKCNGAGKAPRGVSASRSSSRSRSHSRSRSRSRDRAYHKRRRHSRSRSRGRGRDLRDRGWSSGRGSDSEPEGGRGRSRCSSRERGRGSEGRRAGRGRSASPVRRRFRSRSAKRERGRGRQGPGQRGQGEGRSSGRSASRSRSCDGRRARGGRLPSHAPAKVPPERHQQCEEPVPPLWPMPMPATPMPATAACGSHGAFWGAPAAGVQAHALPPQAGCHAMGMSGLQQLLMLGGGGQEGAVKGVSGDGGCGLPSQQAGSTAQGPAVWGAGGGGVAAGEGGKGPAGAAWWE